MAEFCWECWNKVHETDAPRSAFVLSWGKDICEECGQWKRVVVALRTWSLHTWFEIWKTK